MDNEYLKLTSEGMYDLLVNDNEFVFTENPTPYTIQQVMTGRPDKISLAFYGTDAYWWLICKANKIPYGFRATYKMRRTIKDRYDLNAITGIYMGRVIAIPSKADIQYNLNILKGL